MREGPALEELLHAGVLLLLCMLCMCLHVCVRVCVCVCVCVQAYVQAYVQHVGAHSAYSAMHQCNDPCLFCTANKSHSTPGGAGGAAGWPCGVMSRGVAPVQRVVGFG